MQLQDFVDEILLEIISFACDWDRLYLRIVGPTGLEGTTFDDVTIDSHLIPYLPQTREKYAFTSQSSSILSQIYSSFKRPSTFTLSVVIGLFP